MGDWESPLLEQDNEGSSLEKVNFFFFLNNLPFVGYMCIYLKCFYTHLQDALPENDAAITSHPVKPETQQIECKSAFPDQKIFLYIIETDTDQTRR